MTRPCSFQDRLYAIEAGNRNANSMQDVLRWDGGYQAQSATFMAFYYTDNNGTKPTMGNYNIGLVLGKKGQRPTTCRSSLTLDVTQRRLD